MVKKINYNKLVKDYLLIFIGSLITALGINIFIVPNKIAPGGVSGIATVIYYISNQTLPVGTVMLILNVPLFIIGFKYIGKRFIARTLVSTILLSFLIDVTHSVSLHIYNNYLVTSFNLPADSSVSAAVLTTGYSTDILLHAIFGGVLMGIGLGIVLRSGATTGGTDLAAKIMNHFVPGLTVGQYLLLIDGGIVLLAAVTFKSVLLALYSIITLFLTSKTIDAIVEGVNFAKSVYIISDKTDEIANAIMKELERGVTSLKGKGMYTRKDRDVLLCVIRRGQLTQLKQIVKSIDPKAFVILSDVREVLGEGFKTYE
ncbi:MAG TPA: YitT family protein [Clostridiaceae bacterium]|nr:YitT family protein [Clostridiaceae bacterium]